MIFTFNITLKELEKALLYAKKHGFEFVDDAGDINKTIAMKVDMHSPLDSKFIGADHDTCVHEITDFDAI